MAHIIALAALALLGYAPLYLLFCKVFPFGRCRAAKCAGGRIFSRNGKHWHDCRRCGGTGKRLRLGTRIRTYTRH